MSLRMSATRQIRRGLGRPFCLLRTQLAAHKKKSARGRSPPARSPVQGSLTFLNWSPPKTRTKQASIYRTVKYRSNGYRFSPRPNLSWSYSQATAESLQKSVRLVQDRVYTYVLSNRWCDLRLQSTRGVKNKPSLPWLPRPSFAAFFIFNQ